MHFRIHFPNQFQAKHINEHWHALARLHYSICTLSGCNLRWAAFRSCDLQSRKVWSCEGVVKEWFDRQHTNTSSLYWENFGEGRIRHTVLKRSSYLRKVLQSIPLCTFVSIAACQLRRGRSRRHYWWSGVRQIEMNAESTQQYGCSQDVLGAIKAWHSESGTPQRAEMGISEKRPLPLALSITFSLAAVCSITR